MERQSGERTPFADGDPASIRCERDRTKGDGRSHAAPRDQFRAGKFPGRGRPHRDAGKTWFFLARQAAPSGRSHRETVRLNPKSARIWPFERVQITAAFSSISGMETALILAR